MKEKLARFMRTPARKAATIAVCAVMVLSVGAASAYAAGVIPERLLVSSTDGEVRYSTDDGATWNEGAPEGMDVEQGEDGAVTWSGESLTWDKNRLMIRNTDGVTEYSADGGETWSETAPDGVQQTINPDGGMSVSGSVSNGGMGEETGEQMLVKNENGEISYSTDGGETWTEGAPEDFNVDYGENGSVRVWNGEEPPASGEGSLRVRNTDGVTEYSTDGGETWSDTIPDEYAQTINADGSVSVQKTR